MKIKRIDDLDKSKKEEAKKEMSNDISDVVKDSFENLEDYFKRKRISKEIADNKNHRVGNIFWKVVSLTGFIGVILLILNFLLFNFWLLKYFIKSLI